MILIALEAICLPMPGSAGVSSAYGAEERPISDQARIRAFQPGEILTYDISWSKIITAGTATMEVGMKTVQGGGDVLTFTVAGRSAGLVDKFITIIDTAQSVFDPHIMQSLSFSIKQIHGKRIKSRTQIFDHDKKIVVDTSDNEHPETFSVPEPIQDALSCLYYLRTREDFSVGKTMMIDVHDSGKNWSVEVRTLGRERVKTPAGEFAAIKVRTHPLYEGVFMNKGEVTIWLTDDDSKVPVLMKSTLSVGSFIFTLTNMKPGNGKH